MKLWETLVGCLRICHIVADDFGKHVVASTAVFCLAPMGIEHVTLAPGLLIGDLAHLRFYLRQTPHGPRHTGSVRCREMRRVADRLQGGPWSRLLGPWPCTAPSLPVWWDLWVPPAMTQSKGGGTSLLRLWHLNMTTIYWHTPDTPFAGVKALVAMPCGH